MGKRERITKQERICRVRSKFFDDAEAGEPGAEAVVELCDCLENMMASGSNDIAQLIAARDVVEQAFPQKKRGELQGLLALVGNKLAQMRARNKGRILPPYRQGHGGDRPGTEAI